MINLSIDAQPSALIPRGVADYFWAEAEQRRQLEALLLETFRRWGYGDVLPPMFEYADTLSSRANSELQAALVRFQDRDGSTLALRADMTIAVARLVGTRLHDWPMPQRFCYAGSVFRYTELQAGRQREFWQAGIELIGATAPAADAEILALTAKALQRAGLVDFRLVVGQMGYFHGLLQALHLPPDQQRMLHQAVDLNSEAGLADFMRVAALPRAQRRAVEQLPHLSGQNVEAILSQADQLCLNEPMQSAVANMRAICQALASYGLLDVLYLDLTEIHNLGYYTGITFEALAPGLGFPVAAGGRYDHLIGSFGKPQAAVGAAFTLDRILMAKHSATLRHQTPHPIAPDLLVAAQDSAECLAIVEMWRAQGTTVAVDVCARQDNELREMAHQIGSQWVLIWTGNGFDVYENAAPSQASAYYLSAAEAKLKIWQINTQRL